MSGRGGRCVALLLLLILVISEARRYGRQQLAEDVGRWAGGAVGEKRGAQGDPVLWTVNWRNLTAEALSRVPSSFFENITLREFESIPFSACNGFREIQIRYFNPRLVSQFSSDCFSRLTPSTMSGWPPQLIPMFSNTCCSVLRGSQLNQWDSTQIQALPCTCISKFNNQFFNQIEAPKLEYFTGPQMQCITSEQLRCFNSSTLGNFLSSQIGELSGQAISALSSSQLVVMWKRWGTSVFGNIFSPDKETLIPTPVIENYKEMIDLEEQLAMDRFTNLFLDDNSSWIKMSLIRSDSFNNFSQNLYTSLTTALYGLRKTQLLQIPPSIFLSFSPSQAQYLLSDTLSHMSSEQYDKVSGAFLAALDLSLIPLPVIPTLSIQQLKSLNCTQLFNNLTKQQRNALTQQQLPILFKCVYIPETRFPSYVYILIGVGCGLLILGAITLVAYCCKKKPGYIEIVNS